MRHQDGFVILVRHQGEVLPEYDAIAFTQAIATTMDVNRNILHAGNYTARRSYFYVIPEKDVFDRQMTIKFSLAKGFDFRNGNLLNITLRTKGMATKNQVRRQLIWKHQMPVANESDTEPSFAWRISMAKGDSMASSRQWEEQFSMVITLDLGLSESRFEKDNEAAMEAFKPLPGNAHFVEIICRPSESRNPKESNSSASPYETRSKSGKSNDTPLINGEEKRKRAESPKMSSGNANASAQESGDDRPGQDTQSILGTSDDDSSKTCSVPNAAKSTPMSSPSHGQTQESYSTPPEFPSAQAIRPTTPIVDSTSEETNKTQPNRSSGNKQPKAARMNPTSVKQAKSDVIDFTKDLDEDDDKRQEIFHQIKDKELELKQKRLEKEEIQAERELNALRRTRMRLGRTPSSPLARMSASSPMGALSSD